MSFVGTIAVLANAGFLDSATLSGPIQQSREEGFQGFIHECNQGDFFGELQPAQAAAKQGFSKGPEVTNLEEHPLTSPSHAPTRLVGHVTRW